MSRNAVETVMGAVVLVVAAVFLFFAYTTTKVAANRLGLVVTELSAEQKREMKLSGGLMVAEVRPDAKADVRKGDILVMVVHKGQQTELKTADQFNRLLASLDRNAVITLQVRRGESTAFVTVSGLTDKG